MKRMRRVHVVLLISILVAYIQPAVNSTPYATRVPDTLARVQNLLVLFVLVMIFLGAGFFILVSLRWRRHIPQTNWLRGVTERPLQNRLLGTNGRGIFAFLSLVVVVLVAASCGAQPVPAPTIPKTNTSPPDVPFLPAGSEGGAALVDLNTGSDMAVASALNTQAVHGADVHPVW